MRSQADLIVFSHLAWNFVYQRPQHLLSRLAEHYRVIFIEEPGLAEQPHWKYQAVNDNVVVAQARTPGLTHGYSEEQLEIIGPMLAELKRHQQIGQHMVWFYTPLALPLLTYLQPELVIYDCMDALDMFMHAPQLLKDREAGLLAQADLVFTGGPSLYGRLQNRHHSVHCFSSSVDASHYAAANAHLRAEPGDQKAIARPRLGYFGVIDERIDLPLLEGVAVQRPEWQIVMVGPVAKIDPSQLPRQANIHYLGQKQYAELPAYLDGWDVCLLPFALNNSTRFISPTKTLEYMAAEKPIVSTPIKDVAEPFSDIVYLADDVPAFIAACDRALHQSEDEAQRRRQKMLAVLASTSWTETVAKMHGLIQNKLASRKMAPPPCVSPGRSNPPVVVIGAGPTGLSAAYHLGNDALLLEQNNRVGGWCRSIDVNGFTFDYAGHIMFSNEPYVHELYELLLKGNVHWQNREAWIYSKNVYTRYPFQGALYGLPPEVIKECVVGAIEARFGPLKNSPKRVADTNGQTNGNGPLPSISDGEKVARKARAPCDGGDVEDCCGDGVMESTSPLGIAADSSPANFEDFIYQVWGNGIAKHFAIPYNRKLWAVPLSEMETSWLGGRVPMPDLEEVIEGALQPTAKPMGPNARFGYPLRGGFQALMDGFLPFIGTQLQLNARVAKVSPNAHTLTLADGTVIPYKHLISTMPLPTLVRLMGNEVPPEVREAARGLRHVSVRCVHLGVGRENLTEKHWIYYPEQTVFHRVFVQGNASPHCNPAGGFGLTCEITYSAYKPLPCDGNALIERCIEDCRQVGLFQASDPIWATAQVDLPYAYVVYDHARPKIVAMIRKWMESHDVVLAGRYSEWEYYNSDHAFIAGKTAAETVMNVVPGRRTGMLPATLGKTASS